MKFLQRLFSTCLFPRSARQAACIGFCAALIAGLLAIALGIGDEGFEDGYIELARSLARGEGFRFSQEEPIVLHRPPVYPLLLTPIAAAPEGAQRILLVLLHSLLIAVACAQTFALANRWFGALVAGWGALLPLTDPWLLATTKTTVTSYVETVLYLALAAWFVEAVRSTDRDTFTWRRAAAFGLVSGLLTLTHASKLLTALLLLAVVAGMGLARGSRRAPGAAALALVVMALAIAPWTYRNWRVAGRFIPVATNAGYSYFAGNAHWGITAPMQARGETWQAATLRHAGVDAAPDDVGRYWGVYNPDLNRRLDEAMKAHVRAHPADFAKKLALHAMEYYFPISHPIYSKLTGETTASWRNTLVNAKALDWGLISVYHAGLLALAAAGLAVGKNAGDRLAAWWIALLVAAYIGPYLPFLVKAGFARYTLATIPLLAVLAARCRGLGRTDSRDHA